MHRVPKSPPLKPTVHSELIQPACHLPTLEHDSVNTAATLLIRPSDDNRKHWRSRVWKGDEMMVADERRLKARRKEVEE